MTTEPVIELSDLCFSYGTNEVLHNVSLCIGERSMVAIVGPNGGGKTTLLFLVLGLLDPQRGSVRVFGRVPAEGRRRIGYVPQHLVFDTGFPVSVFDVVRMGRVDRHFLGGYRTADNQAAAHALEEVGLADLRKRPFSQLSGGERQRVLIARALVSEPRLLLLDEPTASVDSRAEHRLYDLFCRLNERITIVFVSHNLGVVTRHVSHVVCVNRTAALHPIGEIVSSTFTGAHGDELAVLLHDVHCHVTDPSRAMQSEHAAHGDRPV